MCVREDVDFRSVMTLKRHAIAAVGLSEICYDV